MAKPTKEDAMLMLQLADLYTTMRRVEGAPDLMSRAFPKTYADFKAKYPDEAGPAWRAVAAEGNYFETLGLLVRRGLFNEELCLEWLAVAMAWRQVSPMLLAWREESGEPGLYEHFEWLAGRQS